MNPKIIPLQDELRFEMREERMNLISQRRLDELAEKKQREIDLAIMKEEEERKNYEVRQKLESMEKGKQLDWEIRVQILEEKKYK